MAVLETHIFKAHNNIYIEQPEENYRTREIRTEMVFPDCVNENTGMLVLIPGYGGNIDSHVFRKMREVFAEQYNFIIQCNVIILEIDLWIQMSRKRCDLLQT